MRSQNATYEFTKIEIISSLLRLERQQKDLLKSISNSFGSPIEKYVYTPPLLPENYTRFQTKMAKVYASFRPKRRKNGTYLYGS